jgi:hypothetical protein
VTFGPSFTKEPTMATSKAKPKAAGATGTAVATRKASSGAIVSIQEQLKAQAAAMAGRIAPPSGNKIKCGQDKRFTLPDGSKADALDLVVVDFTSKNTFYEGAYDANNIVPPTCFAIGAEPKSMVPSKNAPVRQNDDCVSCPLNQFGSAGKGKACKNGRVLAVLPPDADADTPLWVLEVSPTAIKGFDGFVGNVNRLFGLPPIGAVVTVGFNEAETFASLTFTDPRPNENLEVHFARQAEAIELLTVEPDVSSYGQAPAKPAGRAAHAARRPTAAARR